MLIRLLVLGPILFTVIYFSHDLIVGLANDFSNSITGGISRLRGKMIGAVLLGIGMGVLIVGGRLLIFAPLRERILLESISQGFPADAAGRWFLIAIECAIGVVLLVGLYSIIRQAPWRIILFSVLPGTLALCGMTTTSLRDETDLITVITQKNALFEALMSLNDNRLRVPPPMSATPAQIGKGIRQTLIESRSPVLMVWSDTFYVYNDTLYLSGRFDYYDVEFKGDSMRETPYQLVVATPKDLSTQFRKLLYGELNLVEGSGGEIFGSTQNNAAFIHLIRGLDYIEDSRLNESLKCLDSAVSEDVKYPLPYVYKAYVLCLLADGRWSRDAALEDYKRPYPSFADSVSFLLSRADSLVRLESRIGTAQRRVVVSFLIPSVRGLLHQVCGRIYTDYYEASLERPLSKVNVLSTTSVEFAINCLRGARDEYLEALSVNPSSFKVVNNLSVIYFDLGKIYAWEQDTARARENTKLALKTIDRAIALNPMEPGYLVNKGVYQLQGIKFGQTGDFDLSSIRSLLLQAIAETDKQRWKGAGYYNLACAESYLGETGAAVRYLCRAVHTHYRNDIIDRSMRDEYLTNLRNYFHSSNRDNFEQFLSQCEVNDSASISPNP